MHTKGHIIACPLGAPGSPLHSHGSILHFLSWGKKEAILACCWSDLESDNAAHFLVHLYIINHSHLTLKPIVSSRLLDLLDFYFFHVVSPLSRNDDRREVTFCGFFWFFHEALQHGWDSHYFQYTEKLSAPCKQKKLISWFSVSSIFSQFSGVPSIAASSTSQTLPCPWLLWKPNNPVSWLPDIILLKDNFLTVFYLSVMMDSQYVNLEVTELHIPGFHSLCISGRWTPRGHFMQDIESKGSGSYMIFTLRRWSAMGPVAAHANKASYQDDVCELPTSVLLSLQLLFTI